MQQLRAGFLVQATLLHEFQQVYEELLSPRGLSFVELALEEWHGKCDFSTLSRALEAHDATLLAVEIDDARGKRISVADGDIPGSALDASKLTALWVLADDRFEPAEVAASEDSEERA